MNKKREALAILLALSVVLAVCWGAGHLLMPQRTQYGSDWDHFLQEQENSLDVLFFGSSLVYCDVIPSVLREECGLSSYVMAGPEQTIPVSYYYAREAFRTQSPQLVVQEVTGMFFPEYTNYTLANIGYMPLGRARLEATLFAAEGDALPGLLLPIVSYHSRWRDVTGEELAARIAPGQSQTAGYTLITDACPPPADRERDYTADSDNYRRNLDYLARLRDLCAENGAQLLLYITPSAGKIPPAALDALKQDAAKLGVTLEDFNEALPEMNIDNNTDWFDYLHFNVYGAQKFSRWLGGRLAQYGFQPVPVDEALWTGRTAYIQTALTK